MCPICRLEQVQYRFNIASLHRLLRSGYPVEAYCESCDEFWPIGTEQRIELGEVVAFWRNFDSQKDGSAPAPPRELSS
jgi:hypothetical protein